MRYGVQTTTTPYQPDKIYFRCMFHEFFYGPFNDELETVEALKKLDQADPMWDYDPFSLHYGASPLPSDFVFGFPRLEPELEMRIRSGR